MRFVNQEETKMSNSHKDGKTYYLLSYNKLKVFNPDKVATHLDWQNNPYTAFYLYSRCTYKPIGFLGKNVFESKKDALPFVQKELERHKKIVNKLQKIINNLDEDLEEQKK